MPARGQIGANYFDLLKESQVWINLEPQGLEPGPNPIEFNVTLAFPGRSLPDAPLAVDLRVEAYCLLFPTRIRQAQLALSVYGADLELARSTDPLQLKPACGHDIGWLDVIIARVPFATLRRIAAAGRVEMHALGFDVRLSPADLQALQTFVSAVADGVTLR